MVKGEKKNDGKQLEKAIEAIERQVLKEIDQSSIAVLNIERNRRLLIKGVRHEIDVYVKVDLKIGTELIYIFECKDYRKGKSVSKNEIIIFEEKIDVFNAQKGYFVASKFGKDATNRAKQSNRIQLLTFDVDINLHKNDLILPVVTTFKNLTVNVTTLPKNIVKGEIGQKVLKTYFSEETIDSRLSGLIESSFSINGSFHMQDGVYHEILNKEDIRVFNILYRDCEFDGVILDLLHFTIVLELQVSEPEIEVFYNVPLKGKFSRYTYKKGNSSEKSVIEITTDQKGNSNINIVRL